MIAQLNDVTILLIDVKATQGTMLLKPQGPIF